MAQKVLVVDDEADIRRLVQLTLQDSRYEVLLAKDGEEALRMVQEEQPQLIFLDVMMPKKDGYEVCQLLKADPATAWIKIVMLTAKAQEFDRRRAMEVGADDYFTKPFSPIDLLDKVEEVLGEDGP